MTLFQFLVYTRQLQGVSMSAIAEAFGIGIRQLQRILSGDRKRTMLVSLRAANMFHCPIAALDGLITELDARKLAKSEMMRRRR